MKIELRTKETKMPGRKLFTNRSPHPLSVTLKVRKSEDPRDSAGSKDFSLPAGQSQWQEYGNDIDIYLNAINLVAENNGAKIAQQLIVITRGSPLDNELNMFNAIDFGYANNTFYVSTRQVN
jgi:hypothetical protein